MGQYRYNGKDCVTTIKPSLRYRDVLTATDDDSTTSFLDVEIVPPTGVKFAKNNDYYLRVKVPQNMNYVMGFNIKLVKQETNTTFVYQFVRNVTIDRGGSGVGSYKAVLYGYPIDDPNQTIDIALPLLYDSNVPSEESKIYYQEVSKKRTYYLGNSDGSYTKTYDINEISVSPTWRDEDTASFGIFELAFRPIEDFETIVLEMVRTTEDYSIQNVIDGKNVYGRLVDIDKIKNDPEGITLYHLNNLVDYMNPGSSLIHIGIWGRPGLPMSINGEEIHIGPSGFYEIDSIPIDSIGMIVGDNDFSKNFTIDYMYDDGQDVISTE